MELFEHITSMGQPWSMIVLIVLISCAIGLVGTIAKQIRKYACHRQETELKREMVERGFSAEEIERVIAAKSTTMRAD
jgi:cell division protein FtsL